MPPAIFCAACGVMPAVCAHGGEPLALTRPDGAAYVVPGEPCRLCAGCCGCGKNEGGADAGAAEGEGELTP